MTFPASDANAIPSPLPPEASSDHPELWITQDPSAPRFDRISLQLERRGVTEQISTAPDASGKQADGSSIPSVRPTVRCSRSKAENPQVEFWERQTIWTESIVAKLDDAGHRATADQIRHCHSEVSYRRCRGCSGVSKFYNRCDKFWCPLCTPRLARERRQEVEWWTKECLQPKHVVLTVRNSAVITKSRVVALKEAFKRLRRSKFASGWVGGFYRLECTNEGQGWHLHIHALVNARWIDARELAVQWAKQVGQDFAIVKVKDCRDASYLAEVTKYAVKPSELAKWSGDDIAAFVRAFEGVRGFGVFGSLYGKRTEWKNWLEEQEIDRRRCDCGCADFQILSENEFLAMDLQPGHRTVQKASIPPPQPFLIQFPSVSPYAVGA